MQLSVRQITGAFRPLSIRQQSYRVPPCVGSSNALDAPSEASTQVPFTFWRNSVPGFFAQTAHTLTDRPDRPKDADAADADLAVPKASLSDLENLFKQHVKSVPKGSRPSSASPCVLDDTQHPIKASSLPTYAWPFLTRLRLAGHDVFVVGGTVRDLLLNQEPKDLDVVTTASLQQVKLIADRCHIVGQRYPIALVHASRNRVIEVSTFQPSKATPIDAADLKKQGRQGKLRPDQLDKSWGRLWQDNMQERDFTLNAIMFDPFTHLLFDYVGGLADCSKRRLQCCKDPNESFQEDPPRMLRAVRLAARCDLKISSEVEAAIRKCASRLAGVSGSRLYGEAINIFCQGASLQSFQLLWRLRLLDEVMLPYAEYARMHKVSRTKPLPHDMTKWPLLLRLLYSLDKHACVEQRVAMTVVSAVLAAPIIVDAIAAHRAELQNIISGTSAKLSKKTAQRLSVGFDSRLGSQAVSAAVVQGAVLRWEARLHSSVKVDTAVQQQHVLMTCIIAAALETLRTRLPAGVLPRANVTAARQLLTAFYSTSAQQIQDDADDEDNTASHTATNFDAKKGKFAHPQQHTSLHWQFTLENIFHQAESQWKQLLL